jgi:hypothetical protein
VRTVAAATVPPGGKRIVKKLLVIGIIQKRTRAPIHTWTFCRKSMYGFEERGDGLYFFSGVEELRQS